MAIFLTIILSSLWTCRSVRKSAKRGEIPEALGRYATGLESSFIAFAVGGSFVSFQYIEMLWHFFALAMALHQVAVNEAAAMRLKAEAQATKPATPSAAATPEPEPEFAWG